MPLDGAGARGTRSMELGWVSGLAMERRQVPRRAAAVLFLCSAGDRKGSWRGGQNT
jgi:hypothetical protein